MIETGHSWVEVEISDLERKKSVKVKALVDISDIIDKVLIGVVTLESLGFAVDPKTGTLREEPLLLY